MAHFVRDTLREGLDLSATLDTYTQERGYPPSQRRAIASLLQHVDQPC
jgi:hypothetical protein